MQPTKSATAVAVLTLVWVLALGALVVWLFGLGMQGWADGGASADLERRTTTVLILLAATAAGGPAVIAVVAFNGRLVRTGVVYSVLAGLLAVPLTVAALRAPAPSPSPDPGPPVCQEHSGSDTRCPGG
jgi:hypothetical protein